MADVLALLREYNITNKSYVEKGEEIIFGDFAWPKNTKTNFIVWGTGKDNDVKDFYSLDCVVYLLKNIDLPHAQYVRQAANSGIPVVRLPDRRDLLSYLKGETSSAPSIDRTAPVDISLRRLVTKSDFDIESSEFGEPISKKSRNECLDEDESLEIEKQKFVANLDKPNYQSTIIDSEQLKGSTLSESIPIDKLQYLRAKFRAKQQQTIKTDENQAKTQTKLEEDREFPVGLATSTLGSVEANLENNELISDSAPNVVITDEEFASNNILKAKTMKNIIGVMDKQSKRNVIAADEKSIRALLSKEKKWRNRSSCLQSQVKCFYDNIVLGILRNVMMRENAPETKPLSNHQILKNSLSQQQQQQAKINPQSGTQIYSRYNQERFNQKEDTAGFKIDTMATYHGKRLNNLNNKSSINNENTQNSLMNGGIKDPRQTPDSYARQIRQASEARVAARIRNKASRIPIIIIPATPTSLITMVNARDILEDMNFISPQEKIAKGCRRETEIMIHIRRQDGKSHPFRIVDQPNRLSSEDWERVVAVFVQGQTWQFKGWPISSDPAVIFSLVKGFHVKYSHLPLDANVAKWNVKVISMDQRRRHLDKANFQMIWDQIERHITKNKPNLV